MYYFSPPPNFFDVSRLQNLPVFGITTMSHVVSSVDVKQICSIAIRAGMLMDFLIMNTPEYSIEGSFFNQYEGAC